MFMMKEFIAEIRKTHSYVDSCSSMDSWGESFRFKMLAGKQTIKPKGFDDGGTHRYRIIGSKKLSQKKQAQALHDTLSHHGCTHEYDCCGCASHYVTITRIKPGLFSASIKTSFNY